jgi:hypothetical protein
MHITRTLTPLAVAAGIAGASPASSSARFLDETAPVRQHLERCYQLDPIATEGRRAMHRVPCGEPTRGAQEAAVTVSKLHAAPPRRDSPWDAIALAAAGSGLVLSAAAVALARAPRTRRPRRMA